MLLEGLHIPLTTPFHSDGRFNPHKLAANVTRYSKTPAAGLIVLGPQGEPTLLSDDEARETLRTAAQAAAPEKLLIAGSSRDSVHATLALANFAADLHYDAVLIALPSVLAAETPSPREALSYFQTIADRSPLPIILLSTSSRGLSVEAITELANHPNIIGLLDAASSKSHAVRIEQILQQTTAIRREVTVTPTFTAVTARMLAAATSINTSALISASTLTQTSATATVETPKSPLRTRTKSVSFQIISAATTGALDGLNAGAVGIAPAFAACAPQACYEVFAAWKDSDQQLATEKQTRLTSPALLTENNPGLLKFACDLNGYFGGFPHLPHLPPTGEQRAALQALMQGIHT